MTSRAPSAATGARLCGPAIAITSARRSDPRDTSRRPVTPPAPFTRRRSPGPTASVSSRTCAAVSAGTGNTAAASQETPAGLRATDAEGAISVGAHVPWSRNGSGWVITSSPDAQSVTMLPTAVTSPAASTPSAIGGRRPTSQPPVRTTSSQLPTPAALTRISTSSPASARGPDTSISPTSPPVRRIPATSIRYLRVEWDGWPTFDRLGAFGSSSFVDRRGANPLAYSWFLPRARHAVRCVRASCHRRDLVVDTPQQVIPRSDEVPGSFRLERRGQRVDIDARGFELRQRVIRIAAIGRDRLADATMVVEGPQRRLGHRVDRVRRAQTVDVHRVGGVGVLGAGAGPHQPLHTRAGVRETLPAS